MWRVWCLLLIQSATGTKPLTIQSFECENPDTSWAKSFSHTYNLQFAGDPSNTDAITCRQAFCSNLIPFTNYTRTKKFWGSVTAVHNLYYFSITMITMRNFIPFHFYCICYTSMHAHYCNRSYHEIETFWRCCSNCCIIAWANSISQGTVK